MLGMLGLGGVTDREDRVAEFMVRGVLPKMLPEAAAIVAVPAATEVTRPETFTAATDGSDEVQVTREVTSKLVPSE
jgi:hypothetical protein